jgi:excinuclease UvrABC nuclease subunit
MNRYPSPERVMRRVKQLWHPTAADRADQEAEANAPAPGVYKLFRRDRMIYVGQSRDVHARVKQHKANGRAYDRYDWEEIRDPVERTRVERELIEEYQPIENVKHTLRYSIPRMLKKLEEVYRKSGK